jgi:hypothetical protein
VGTTIIVALPFAGAAAAGARRPMLAAADLPRQAAGGADA